MATKLKANTVSFAELVVMGVAGSAPGFSIATAIAPLLGTSGAVTPNALLIFAIPMLGIAMAYRGLNAKDASAGAAYEWTKQVFGRFFGYFSGWALLVASMVFMVTGSVPLGTATIDLVNPDLASNVVLTTGLGAAWFLGLAILVLRGIKLTSKFMLVVNISGLVILFGISIAALLHGFTGGAVTPFTMSMFSFAYPDGTFAQSCLLVVFLYWGWDVTCNLSEEARSKPVNASGTSGVVSMFITIASFVSFTVAAMMLFSLKDASGFSDNLIYHVAIQAGLGPFGGMLASIALVFSSVATLVTTMLQCSRTLFAMGRDRALPTALGYTSNTNQSPTWAMYVIIVLGLMMIFMASFLPTVAKIVSESLNAMAIQVCYYYGLAGFVCFWEYRLSYRKSFSTFLSYGVFPLLSGITLVVLAGYAITTFDTWTRVVGIGGLVAGIVFYNPDGYGTQSMFPFLERFMVRFRNGR